MPTDKPKRGGRPTKLNEQVIAEICRFIEAGNWFEVSCRLAGINEETGNVWLRLGRGQDVPNHKPQPIHKQFTEAVQAAVDRREAALAMRIRQAAQPRDVTTRSTTVDKDGNRTETVREAREDGDWRAAAWILERTAPDRWGKQRLEVTGADGGPMQVEVAGGLDDEKRIAAVAALLDTARARAAGQVPPAD